MLTQVNQYGMYFIGLAIIATVAHRDQWYKAYDGNQILFALSGPQFVKKKAEYFRLNMVIRDNERFKYITNYSIFKESRNSDHLTVILERESYYFTTLTFPRYIQIQDILYRNHTMKFPTAVVEILPYPVVLNESTYDVETNQLIIFGKNLIGAKAVHLRFDPFMFYGTDYIDLSAYPLEEDQVSLLILNLPRKVNLDPSPLYLTHIDTGAGLERLPRKMCLITCEVQERADPVHAISDSVRKNRICVWLERTKSAIVKFIDRMKGICRKVIQKARDCIHYGWNYSLFALLTRLFPIVSCDYEL